MWDVTNSDAVRDLLGDDVDYRSKAYTYGIIVTPTT